MGNAQPDKRVTILSYPVAAEIIFLKDYTTKILNLKYASSQNYHIPLEITQINSLSHANVDAYNYRDNFFRTN